MDQNPSAIVIEKTGKLIRKSIYTFLKHFHFFATVPVTFLLPFSASILLSRTLHRSILQPNSVFFYPARASFLGLNLSEIIFGYVLSLPFALSFLVMAKAFIIQSLNQQKLSFVSLYKPLVFTYLCSVVLVITLNMVTVSLLFIASDFVEELSGLSPDNPFLMLVFETIFYTLFTNTIIISNFALVMAAMDAKYTTGFTAILEACLLRKGSKSMALLLALPINLGLAAIAELFRYRIERTYYHDPGRATVCLVLEGMLIAYMFSLLIVLDTIACCLFVKSWQLSNFRREEEEEEEICYIQIEIIKNKS